MRASHNFSAEFDDENLIAVGGLVPVMLLADHARPSRTPTGKLLPEHPSIRSKNPLGVSRLSPAPACLAHRSGAGV